MSSKPKNDAQSSPGASARRSRYWLARGVALGLGLFVAVALSELALRVAGVGYPNFYETDFYCGFRLRPHASGMWNHEGNGYVAINSHGFRGPEFRVEKPRNVFRVAVLGDSFIEARQVDEEQTFCRRLEQLLNARATDHRVFQVINCGVSGYGTTQELLLLEHAVAPLAPDVVLLAIYPDNDVRNNSRKLEGDPLRPYLQLATNEELDHRMDFRFREDPLWLAQASTWAKGKEKLIGWSRLLQLLKAAKRGASSVNASPVGETMMMADVGQVPYIYKPSLEPDHVEAWEVTALLIESMGQCCARREIPFFVMNVSSSLQAWPDPNYRSKIAARCGIEQLFYSEQRLHEICAEREIAFLPLASAMQRTAELRGEFLHGFPNLAEGVGHWNELGNEVAAEIVAEWLWPRLPPAELPPAELPPAELPQAELPQAAPSN